jgi:hypothetical protein
MKLALVACMVLMTGCLWANEKSESLSGFGGRAILGTDGHPSGGAIDGTLGYAGLIADFEAEARELSRGGDLMAPTVPGQLPFIGPPTRALGLGVGLDVRASLLGILSSDHRLERYFDVGLDAGAGVGGAFADAPHELTGTASGWYGAWGELGTVRAGSGYVALTFGIRREVFNEHFFDQTQLLVGLAWRKHTLTPFSGLNLRD